MGLNTTHGAWDGPYSMFNTFRYALARRININLDEYFGYPMASKELKDIDHPLRYLFDHSDCDGELTSSECTLIAFGIDQVMNAITIDEMADNVIADMKGNYRMQDFYQDCERFKNGCLMAANKNENLIFQ